MKIKWNEKYTTIAVYTFLVFSSTIVFYLIASQVEGFRLQMNSIIGIFSPFIIGFVMAYLFDFILSFYERHLVKSVKMFPQENKKSRLLSVFLTYVTVAFLFFLFLKFIFPQLLESLVGLVNEIPNYVKEISLKVDELSQSFEIRPEYNEMILDKWNEFVEFILKFLTDLIPKIGNFTKGMLSSLWNIVLGLIISIYLLIDKDNLMALSKKVTYGILPKNRADSAVDLVHRSDHIFGRFLSGKMLDSLIIGVLTFVVLLIFKMPYANLIAFIIGVINIIPFFGPFIGAIPSFFIIMFESVPMALWFLVIIFVIQQIDGNIIGPKILGDSLGISAFWILFSLLVAGKLFGFVGLIIGVPLFVFIYSILKDHIESRLKNKGLPENTSAYKEKSID